MKWIALLLAALLGAGQPDTRPRFEVASVRPLAPSASHTTTWSQPGSGRFDGHAVTLAFMVALAYNVDSAKIEGMPEWMNEDAFEVSAKPEDGVKLSREELQPRLQRLIEERFHLVVHRDERLVKGYALVVAKNGFKLKPADAKVDACSHGYLYAGGLQLQNCTVKTLASMLASPAGQPVEDRTGLTGNFDFKLAYAKEGDVDSTLPSFFTAVQESMGLRLEPTKVPVSFLVIDHADRIPTDN